MEPFARKSLGQHFLQDPATARRIVDLVDPQPREIVLEIGPGRGALTAELVARSGRLAAVEIDRVLAGQLQDRFGASLVVFHEDVLRLDLTRVRNALESERRQRLVIVGNLPYNISKPVALRLVAQREVVDRAVLMFQKEVAERLVSPPGRKSYGPLTVLAGSAFEIRREFDLRPGAFRPVPRVVSSVTSWLRREDAGALRVDEEARLRACLAASFGRRRQTLQRNLAAAVGSAERSAALLERAGIDGKLRAEQVPPDGFRRLASAWERSP